MKRINHGRPQKLEECNYLQLAEEKAAVQRALLWLEGARGRPTAKIDRDAARPLYDRYRAVKRLVARYDSVRYNLLCSYDSIYNYSKIVFFFLR